MAEPRLTASQRVKTHAIAGVVSPALAGLCRTVTWKVEAESRYHDVLAAGRVPIMVFWHGRILAATWVFRHRGIVALTSANFDGQWIARVIERFGHRTVSGSSSHGGMRALLRLKREMESGRPAAFALDGPRGPARIAQPGAVWLAAATGNPILPFHAEASASWEISSWDRTQIPKPFATVALSVGEPVEVPDTSERGIADGCARVQEVLRAAEARTRAALDGPP